MLLFARRPRIAFHRLFVCAGLIACAFVLTLNLSSAYAQTLPQLASDEDPGNALPVTIRTQLNQPTVREDALRLVREFRAEAYDEGIVTLPAGMTREQYISNFGWDQDLEKIAVQRGIEANLRLAHERPDGTMCFTARTENRGSYGEILAWPGAQMDTGFSIWKLEKPDYIKKINGESDYGETGHYEAIIDPENTAYGFAGPIVNGSSYGSCASGEFGDWTANDASVGYTGAYDATVNIVDSNALSASFVLKSSKATIAPGHTSQLSMPVTLVGYEGMDAWVDASRATYTSSNSKVASVDANGVVTAGEEGTATITAQVGDKQASTQVTVSSRQDMYRLYNPNSGEHFYTADPAERDNLDNIGWNYEGVGWTAPTDSSVPVYRLYNPNAGDHHYTTSAPEKDNLVQLGWNYEDVGWYSADESGAPLYRQYNPNQFAWNHNYTLDKGENDYLVSIGWNYEGIGWYGLK